MDNIFVPRQEKLLYHLLKAGTNGYWCDEAKVFLGESLRQFAKYGRIDLNDVDELQGIFLKSFDDVARNNGWVTGQTEETLCTDLELWDFIFSNSKLTISFMNHWDTNSDFQSLVEVIKKNQIGCYADFRNIPHYLHSNQDGCHDWVKFRLNYLPKTLKSFEQVKSQFKIFSIENWDEVKNILIHENLENMQKSYSIWGKFANQHDFSNRETIKKTIDTYLTRKTETKALAEPKSISIMNNTDKILSLYPKILQDENFLLSESGRGFLNRLKSGIETSKKEESKTFPVKEFCMDFCMLLCIFAFSKPLANIFIFVLFVILSARLSYLISVAITPTFPSIPEFKEYQFIEEFQSWGYPMDLLCTILADEDLSIQLNNLIENGKEEKWKDLFIASFANVLNKPIEPVYQAMLSVVENKRESLEFLKYLKEMHFSETENGILAELQLGLENISDADTMAKWHTNLSQAYSQAVQGKLVMGNLKKSLAC